MNEPLLHTLPSTTYALFFCTAEKGWCGLYSLLFIFLLVFVNLARFIGGCAVGEKTAPFYQMAMVLLFNIMLLCDSLCGWMLA
ncbi:MAG: hypothetical protein IPG82_00010 [Saprospiraceae bacterium]|nr:hypothetical protein [Saprospiraceae bacterium]